MSEDKLLGYYKIPKDRTEALVYMSRHVFFPTASYGNGQNRKNGFRPDLDEAIFEKVRQILLSAIDDDSEKPTVMATLIPTRPWAADRLGRSTKFRVEVRVAIISEEGTRLGWNKPHYTGTRFGKAELLPPLEDLLHTAVPSVLVSGE